MALQMSAALRNAMLEQIENIGNGLSVVAGTGGVTGSVTAPTLTIFANAIPANPAAADTAASTLAVLTLQTSFMGAAGAVTAGTVSKDVGTWQDASADAGGVATHFRMKTNGGVVFLQGSCGQQVVLANNANTNSGSNVLTLSSTAGIANGMNITGNNVPPAATVLSFVANTSVTMSVAATATITNGTSITFTPDLTIDNATITAGQQVTVTAFSVSMQNG
jgi:hypothetical protein